MTMSKPPFEVSSQQPAGTLEPGLLSQLLTAPAAPAVPAAVDALPVERARGRVRKAPAGSLGRGLAYLAAGALGAGLWALDAYYTLVALSALGLPVQAVIAWPWELSGAALLSWAIPLGAEAIEQVFFGERGWMLAVFLPVAGINVLATGYGLWVAFAGRSGFGQTLAAGSPALWTIAMVGGLGLAFGPGRLVLAATRSLVALVR